MNVIKHVIIVGVFLILIVASSKTRKNKNPCKKLARRYDRWLKQNITDAKSIPPVEGFEEVKFNFGVSGEVLRHIILGSKSDPKLARGKTCEENLEECLQICRDTDECGGVQVSRFKGNYPECLVMSGYDHYSRPGWKAFLVSNDAVDGFEHVMRNRVINGEVLDSIVLSSELIPELERGMTYEENLEECFQICRDTKECGGVQISSFDVISEKCFVMSVKSTLVQSGWTVYLKSVA